MSATKETGKEENAEEAEDNEEHGQRGKHVRRARVKSGAQRESGEVWRRGEERGNCVGPVPG